MNTNQAKMDGFGTGFEVSRKRPFDGLNFHDEIWLLSVGNRPVGAVRGSQLTGGPIRLRRFCLGYCLFWWQLL